MPAIQGELEVVGVLNRLFGRNSGGNEARGLYLSIVEQARAPAFYRDREVPDSIDGRFELVSLHVFLVLHRLNRDHERAGDLAQQLFDILFQDMDASLRELGVGDLGVGPRIKSMAKGLYGRIAAYQAGLDAWPDAGPEVLSAALRRNLYGTVEPSDSSLRLMAAYVKREADHLELQEIDALAAGRVTFGAPPGAGADPA